ncbi:MAG: uracil-DNA glycosylase [Desulfobacterales bacterium]
MRRDLAAWVGEFERALLQRREAGVGGVYCRPETRAVLESWAGKPALGKAAAGESLDAIRADIGECTRCKLHQSRTKIVFGSGNPRAVLLFVGEGPGQEEDRAGEPFVGAAGHLLTRMIEAMRLSRSAVYIANVVKCRPPGNRTPEEDEIATCLPFLMRQIAAVGPRLICTLGACASQALLGTSEPVSRLRGKIHEQGGVKIVPTYHPAYLLRNPEKKREAWEDLKLLMKEYPYDA